MAGNVPQLFNSNGWDFHYGILKSCMYRLLSRKRELNASHLDGTAMTIQGALGVCQSFMVPWSHDSLCRTGTVVSNLRSQSPPPYSRQSMYCFFVVFRFASESDLYTHNDRISSSTNRSSGNSASFLASYTSNDVSQPRLRLLRQRFALNTGCELQNRFINLV